VAAAMWIWIQDITIAHQQKQASENDIPRGNLSDLYPRWLGARELLLRGRDPYGEDITREIQAGYYGRPLDASRPNDPKDQQAFAYPLYVVFVLAPTVGLPFAVVQRAFLALLVAVTAGSVLLWLRALRWRVSAASKVACIILVLGCFPAIQGLKLQQLTLLVAALLAASMAAIVKRQFTLAGALLAIASIKPQLVFLTALWLLVWISGNWRERQRLFWSGAASILVLLLGSECLLPGWIHKFQQATSAYYQYTGGGRFMLDVALSPLGGRLASAVLVVILMVFLWRSRHDAETSASFQWSLAAVLATNLVLIPIFAPYNQVLLVPGVLLASKEVRRLWKANRLSRMLVALTAISIAWPWLAAVALAVAWLFVPAATVQRAWALPMGTTLMIPVSLLALTFAARSTLLSAGDTPQQHHR